MSPTQPPPKRTDEDPLMDRRTTPADRRSGEDRRAGRGDAGSDSGSAADADRRCAADRRQVDRRKASRPARNINQYDMSPDVLEFVNAVNRFRESSGNRFPSAGDILQILKDLGYEKRA